MRHVLPLLLLLPAGCYEDATPATQPPPRREAPVRVTVAGEAPPRVPAAEPPGGCPPGTVPFWVVIPPPGGSYANYEAVMIGNQTFFRDLASGATVPAVAPDGTVPDVTHVEAMPFGLRRLARYRECFALPPP